MRKLGIRTINNFLSGDMYFQRLKALSATGVIIGGICGACNALQADKESKESKKDICIFEDVLEGSFIYGTCGFFAGLFSPVIIPCVIIGGISHLYKKAINK